MALNYTLINALAKAYKQACIMQNNTIEDTPEHKAATSDKDFLIRELIKNYAPLIASNCCHVAKDKWSLNEISAIFNFQLLAALERFKIDSKVNFNTFSFGYLKAVPRIFYENKKMRYCSFKPEYEEYTTVMNFCLDINSILDKEERLILTAFIDNKSNWNKKIDVIFEKICDYFYDSKPSDGSIKGVIYANIA